LLGKNPLAFAAPANAEPPFVLDFATTTDVPLGGLGTETGGHKGYGLSLLVEILCGALSQGAFGDAAAGEPGKIAHFFGAFRIDGFREPQAFKDDLDRLLHDYKESRKAPGAERIYVAGEPEWETEKFNRVHGIPIRAEVWTELEKLADELGIAFTPRAAEVAP
jgi:LDH2 family malate/lactate/ureidoglycolate dehydrogenase